MKPTVEQMVSVITAFAGMERKTAASHPNSDIRENSTQCALVLEAAAEKLRSEITQAVSP